ncbi:MAG: DUF4190 domain-containing protein [Ilumatobacteraceae bacterium]
MSDQPTPSGWFPDPLDRYDHRYFNGMAWTSDVSIDGIRAVDPQGSRPDAPERRSGNRAATSAVVMGSIAIIIAWIPLVVIVGGVLAVLAVVFGVRGLSRSREDGVGRGAAIAGIVMGVIGLAATVVGVILSVIVLRSVIDYIEPGPNITEVTSCEADGRAVHVEGTITNRSDNARDYTVFVELERSTEYAIVEGVAVAGSAPWAVDFTLPAPTSTCDPTTIVQGPFPFDVVVDPIDR